MFTEDAPALYCGVCDHEWSEVLDGEGRRTWGEEADQRREAKRAERTQRLGEQLEIVAG